ncbi:epsin-1 isoform X2 [Pararge aegeria]|nr:epsin-1 isoform X2 [Pararge aegeria]XP_039753768.1 epsin-1 isoform X2 [Pararge aegeria]XP_039753769.1 epsin-1 isoform X2 [Pararge aegeria]
MPRSRDDMQVNVAGLRRNIKNLAHNYSDAQVKVREATSNDPWGPSSTLMAEIADLTYNVMAFTEIMQMIWKRLNDHGKNWRHVYKALVLMEYLIKTGSEKVAMQCKENIFAIHTLKDFQYMEEGKDQGLNVREKAKQLVNLLKDEERLKNERARALKAKQRFAQSASAFGSDGALDTPSSPTYPALGSEPAEWAGGRETELARPLTAGEEELQLQLALAMSREEAEREERRRRSDDVRLQLAISQSQNDFQTDDLRPQLSISQSQYGLQATPVDKKSDQQSHLLDLLDVNLGPPAHAPPPGPAAPLDPWGLPSPPAHAPAARKQPFHLEFAPMDTSPDAWSSVASPAKDPWAPAALAAPAAPAAPADPWAPLAHGKSAVSPTSPASLLSSPSSELEQFDALSQRRHNTLDQVDSQAPDPFDLSLLDGSLAPNTASPAGGVKKSPSAFLGENSSLVNLERLLQPSGPEPAAPNPFTNDQRQLFAPPPPAKLSINEIKQQQMGLAYPTTSPGFPALGSMASTVPPMSMVPTMPMSSMTPTMGVGVASPDPWAPVRAASPWSPPATRHTPNPFLS